VDEWAAAVLKFPGEIVAQVSTSVAVNQENVLRIFGSEGRITVPNPWCASRQAGDTGKIIVQKRDEKEPQEILLPSAVTSFAIEADVVGNAILAGTMEAPAPAMSWEDSLGNMRTLDAWRESIGLVYESEKPANYTYTVTRRPLAIRKKHNMKYGRIPGLDKPVSRLVMGVDNQKAITHASVQFDDFFERGGNCFDTAWVYGGGACEKVLGQWVANRKIRKEVIILDKGAHTPYCTPSDLTEQFLQSLERLQTDYADIYMMHRDNLDVPVGEFIDVLNEHVRAGRMKVFGGSNWSIKRVEEANAYAKAKGLQGFSAISNNFSLARMVSPVWSGCIAASDAESRDWLTNTQLPLMPWSSQARGFFTERAGKHKLDDKELVRCWYSDDNFQRRDRVLEMAKRRGVLPINIALAYVLCQPFPTFPLIGPRTLHELTTSLPGLDVELSPEELRWLNLED
jgi:aryl-alcohol dehydrogenase-like predicted oxidoreductase